MMPPISTYVHLINIYEFNIAFWKKNVSGQPQENIIRIHPLFFPRPFH